jgi:predicted RNase H-like HicB family nuclease
MRYRVLLHKSDEGFDVSVPGLPGCLSQGATEAEALENIRAAITEYMAVIEEQVAGRVVRVLEIGEQP